MKKLTILLGLFIVFSCEDIDETPPVTMITNIQANAELTGIVEVIVDATDDDEVVRVEFFVNDTLRATSESSEASHTFNWDTDVGDNGSYQIYATATDKSDNSASSSILSVTVINYRTANIVNSTLVSLLYRIDNEGDVIWISSGDTVKVQVPKKTTMNFAGYTPTNYCGKILTWDFDVDVSDIDVFWRFWVNDNYFALYTRNSYTEPMKNMEINRSLDGEEWCFDEIPADGTLYFNGFYRAHPNTNIYWYKQSSGYFYIDGDTYKVTYQVPDASHTDRNLYAKYNLQAAEANDGISVESYDDGYMGIPSRDENNTAQGGYGKIEK
jgi:hypothetical protein